LGNWGAILNSFLNKVVKAEGRPGTSPFIAHLCSDVAMMFELKRAHGTIE